MMMKIILISFLGLFTMSCSSNDQYKLSDHYNGKNFFNPGDGNELPGLFSVFKWKLTGQSESWPSEINPPYKLATPVTVSNEKLVATFVGHATFLLQVDNLNILTDPIWNNRASPFSFAGPLRVHPPGIEFDKLPKIDVVVISHNHYDHMDSATIKKLEEKFSPTFIVPLANAEKMKSFGAKKIIELDWWQSTNIDGTKFILTPARHWSSRSLWDRRAALWGSFYIEIKKEKIYFAGDTGYGPHFKEIFKRLSAPTVALLPVGGYEPRWFMKDMHINPEEAVLAHLDLQAKLSLGMHLGTFKLTDEAIDTPIKDLEMAMKKLQVQNFKTLLPGQAIEF